ncbi:hypothetical protein [Limoniibacter endophyticus]|uniref:hypothetical protein n=1 Tax=Limoniibacter endophyticus TaxID=1565040 RepID=UPI001677938C|nr:hypothetical protein [Limoniibacter endophyticus]
MDSRSAAHRSLDHTIIQYVLRHQKSAWPLSMRQALSEVRKAQPECRLSDRQLIDLIAAAAIERNAGVHFDVDTRRQTNASPA